jgi:hypothetical protein
VKVTKIEGQRIGLSMKALNRIHGAGLPFEKGDRSRSSFEADRLRCLRGGVAGYRRPGSCPEISYERVSIRTNCSMKGTGEMMVLTIDQPGRRISFIKEAAMKKQVVEEGIRFDSKQARF